MIDLQHGDCLDVLRGLADNSVDSIVTDPPYGLSFMGKRWDYDVPAVEVWRECLRVLKPGGHLLAFAGARTQHRMAVRIEDAGFEIRDMIAWIFGSGFPKSLDVSKALDKAAGAVREVVGTRTRPDGRSATTGLLNTSPPPPPLSHASGSTSHNHDRSDAARQWQGWGTALKPALEPITVARKPLDGTVAETVLRWGTGAINVDGGRVGTVAGDDYGRSAAGSDGQVNSGIWSKGTRAKFDQRPHTQGRFPANLIHDGSDEVVGLFPVTKDGTGQGSAARFFYCAKASKADRDDGCARNHHPTVKPTELMRYLCRLVTPPGGTVLDPFMGSGSTGRGAALEGFHFVGIEREADYIEIARARIAAVAPGQLALFT